LKKKKKNKNKKGIKLYKIIKLNSIIF